MTSMPSIKCGHGFHPRSEAQALGSRLRCGTYSPDTTEFGIWGPVWSLDSGDQYAYLSHQIARIAPAMFGNHTID